MTSFTDTWNAAFEAQPADSEGASLGDDRIRSLKLAVKERSDVEHSWAGDGKDGIHSFLTKTVAQRDALAGDDLVTGRLIRNSDRQTLDHYDGSAWASLGVPRYESVAAGFTVTADDFNKVFVFSGADATISFDPAATLGAGFIFQLATVAASAGVPTLDPNGAETLDGATTVRVPQGQKVTVFCDGTTFHFLGKPPFSGVLVNRASDLALNASTDTNPAFNVESFDLLDEYAANVFVPKMRGWYRARLMGTIASLSDTQTFSAKIFKNGTGGTLLANDIVHGSVGGATLSASVSITTLLLTTDNLTPAFNCSSAKTLNSSQASQCNFEVYRVG